MMIIIIIIIVVVVVVVVVVLIIIIIITNAGTSDTGTINSNDRIAETLYSLGTWFVSGIYV